MAPPTPPAADEHHARCALVEAGKVLARAGLNAGFSGNLSVRLPGGDVLVTPSGGRKGALRAEDMVRLRACGTPVEGEEGRVSSELPLHLAIYAACPGVGAVVHAHPIAATAIGLVDRPVNLCLTAEAAALLGPTVRVPYIRPGTSALGEAVARAAALGPTLLLAHHGAVTTGASLDEATARMETLEHVCRVWMAADAANALVPLPDAEVCALREMFGFDPALPVPVIDLGDVSTE